MALPTLEEQGQRAWEVGRYHVYRACARASSYVSPNGGACSCWRTSPTMGRSVPPFVPQTLARPGGFTPLWAIPRGLCPSSGDGSTPFPALSSRYRVSGFRIHVSIRVPTDHAKPGAVTSIDGIGQRLGGRVGDVSIELERRRDRRVAEHRNYDVWGHAIAWVSRSLVVAHLGRRFFEDWTMGARVLKVDSDRTGPRPDAPAAARARCPLCLPPNCAGRLHKPLRTAVWSSPATPCWRGLGQRLRELLSRLSSQFDNLRPSDTSALSPR